MTGKPIDTTTGTTTGTTFGTTIDTTIDTTIGVRDVLRQVAVACAWWLLLVTWAIGVGRYGGADEPAHVIRAAAVADGQILGKLAPNMTGGFRVVQVAAQLTTGDPACYRHDAAVPAVCAVARELPGTVSVATSAGTYPPLYYALIGLPVRWFANPADSGHYRFAALAWNAVVLTIVSARLRRRGPAGIAMIAAVTPAAWLLFGVVNPNGLEILLLLLAWTATADLLSSTPGQRTFVGAVMWVSLPTAIAMAVRPVAALAAIAVLAVVALSTNGTRGWRWRDRIALVAPLLVAGVGLAVWNAVIRLEFDDPRSAADLPIHRAIGRSVRGIPRTLNEMVGSWSWLEFEAPVAPQLLWWAGAAILVVAVWRRPSAMRSAMQSRRALTGWALILLLGPVAFEVAEASRVGFIWQGRYSIPTVLGLGALALGSLRRIRVSQSVQWLACLATAEFVCFWASLRRYTVGTAGSWWLTGSSDRTAATSWHPPLDVGMLLAAHGALLVGGVLVIGRSWRSYSM